MGQNSSITLPVSQATLHCADQALLYDIEMSLGKRIKAARERLTKPEMTQGQLAAAFKITDKAVSSWERGKTIPEPKKLAELARQLQVPCIWLLEGGGPPPDPDSLEVEIESLRPSERAVVRATVKALRKERDSVA